MSRASDIETSEHHAIAAGSCVVLADRELVYAGPLCNAPTTGGAIMLMNPEDFADLAGHFEGARH